MGLGLNRSSMQVWMLWFSIVRYRLAAVIAAILLSGCMTNTQQRNLMHVDCLKPPDPGPCKGAFPGFYYDYQSDRCKVFHYGGCDGERPFESLEACLRACGGKP